MAEIEVGSPRASEPRTSTRHTSVPRISQPRVIVVVLAAIIGVPFGLYGSIFGPYYVLVIGSGVVILGVIAMMRSARRGRIVLTFGAAVIIGAALYITIGVLTPDGVGSGVGSTCDPEYSCQGETGP